MGEVWLAQDERLEEPVALKFLPPEVRADPVALHDLRRETARSHKLTHPNIVRIHDLNEVEGEPAFIAMEFIDGPTLTGLQMRQASRVLSWEFLRPLVQQLCAALDYAHSESVVHRDLKPANIMVDAKGRLKLADFGIAATLSDSVSRVSLRHATSGTLLYMSPQQLAGKRPQAADDIYALGATLYELLTSQPPFYTGDITHQVLHETPEPPQARLAALGIQNDIAPDVAAMVMACLGKEPAQRPQSARAVAGWVGLEVVAKPSLESLAGDVISSVHAEEAAPGASNLAEAAPAAWVGRKALAGIVVFVLLSIFALGGWYWGAHRTEIDRQQTEGTPVPSGPDAAKPLTKVPPKAAGSFELAGKASVPFAGTLPGTIWLVSDSDGENYCFQFAANGVLNYEARRGVRPNGKWQQDGSNVSIDINEGFTLFSGTISGGKLKGKGLSRDGRTWSWEATPKI
jgi:hypothetical protein